MNLIFLLVCTTALRLLIGGSLGLGDDEAYYWEYSRHLDLSYFEHPPMIAYSIRLSVLLFGNTEFAVRFPAVVFSVITMVFVYLLARRIRDDTRDGFLAVMGMNLVPAFSLGVMMALPDAPLSAFWTMTLYLFHRAVRNPIKNTGPRWEWYISGVSLGLALLSKYHAIFLVPSAFLYLVLYPGGRQWLRRKEPYLSLFTAMVIFSPVLYWNSQNQWESFAFHFKARHHGFPFRPDWFFAFLGSQMGFLTPLVFGLCAYALGYLVRRWKRNGSEDDLFLFSFSIVILGFFGLVSFFSLLKPNWALLGYLPLLIAVTGPLRERFGKRLFMSSWTLSAFFMVLVLVQSYHPIFQDVVGAFHFKEIPLDGDLTNDLYGWPEAGKKVAEAIEDMEKEGTPAHIFSYRYQLCAPLAFYTPGTPRVFSSAQWGDSYHHWGTLFSSKGWNGVFLSDNRYFDDPARRYRFSSIKEEPPLKIYRGSHLARIFYIYKCYGYLGE